MGDRDVLMNAISASHEFRISKVDAQEDLLSTGLAQNQEFVISKNQSDEITRNRERVSEIIMMLEKVNSDIENAEENAY
jgi:hypothetical protein